MKKQGLHIIARNVREGRGEIDLVALEGRTLVFVEVKSRTAGSRAGVTGLEKLGPEKLRALRRACVLYRKRTRNDADAWRLDAVTVEFEAGTWRRRIREVRWYPAVAEL